MSQMEIPPQFSYGMPPQYQMGMPPQYQMGMPPPGHPVHVGWNTSSAPLTSLVGLGTLLLLIIHIYFLNIVRPMTGFEAGVVGVGCDLQIWIVAAL